MGKEATMKEKDEVIKETTIKKEGSISELYQKVEDFKNKMTFLNYAMTKTLSDGEGFQDDLVSGYQLTMFDLESEMEKIASMLENLLHEEWLFKCTETRINADAWTSKEKGIQETTKDIDFLKKYVAYISKLKEKAEDLLRRGEKKLQKYQTA